MAQKYFLLTTLHSNLLNLSMTVTTLLQGGLYNMELSGHTKQCGCLRLSSLVQSWSSPLAVPLSFNLNFDFFFFNLLNKLFVWKLQYIKTIRRGGWTGIGIAKVKGFAFFAFISNDSLTGSCSTGLPLLLFYIYSTTYFFSILKKNLYCSLFWLYDTNNQQCKGMPNSAQFCNSFLCIFYVSEANKGST